MVAKPLKLPAAMAAVGTRYGRGTPEILDKKRLRLGLRQSNTVKTYNMSIIYIL